MNTPPETEPEQPDDDVQPAPGASPPPPAGVTDAPLLPAQSREDTDAGWGEYGDRDDDDERLLRDRPPHWGNG